MKMKSLAGVIPVVFESPQVQDTPRRPGVEVEEAPDMEASGIAE